jgi:hypothetical protein
MAVHDVTANLAGDSTDQAFDLHTRGIWCADGREVRHVGEVTGNEQYQNLSNASKCCVLGTSVRRSGRRAVADPYTVIFTGLVRSTR